MPTTLRPFARTRRQGPGTPRRLAERAWRSVQEELGGDAIVIQTDTADVGLEATTGPLQRAKDRLGPWLPRARTESPQVLAESGGLVLLAIPLPAATNERWVAIAPFLVAPLSTAAASEAASTWGGTSTSWLAWSTEQPIWPLRALLRQAATIQARWSAEARCRRAESRGAQWERRSQQAEAEQQLLASLTQLLRVSHPAEEIARSLLERLSGCLPGAGFAFRWAPEGNDGEVQTTAGQRSRLFATCGLCPLAEDDFAQLTADLQILPAAEAVRVEFTASRGESRPVDSRWQALLAPVTAGNQLHGWLAAFQKQGAPEWETQGSQLLGCVGRMLGMHLDNRELYRECTELPRRFVKALVAAIDAKDAYTGGHSDRVARIAVRIALEMKCDPRMLSSVYLAGLLHDIGKIGIADQVLRKSSGLTAEEYDHIKTHPEVGYRILAELQQFADVLPAVLHHHERWDGRGYPARLSGSEIPWIARIMAVADSYDAMTSHRSYRAPLPPDEVDRILREGAGASWDPEVIDAFFRAQADLQEIR